MLIFLKKRLEQLERQTGLNRSAFVGLFCALLLTTALWILCFEWMKAHQSQVPSLQALILGLQTRSRSIIVTKPGSYLAITKGVCLYAFIFSKEKLKNY